MFRAISDFSPMYVILFSVFSFLFGSVIGSFLNVVILRTPLKQSIITEPSHCFSCGHRLAWYDMIPIFSWLFQRGKCRYCKKPFSPRYMIFEAITAVMYCLAFLIFGLTLQLVYSAVLFAVLVVLSGIDIDHYEIPYWCSGVIAVLGISAIFLLPGDGSWQERLISFGVIVVLFGIMVLIGGMGGGDLQLMAGASLLLGYRIFAALLIGIVLGSIYGVIKKIRDKKDEKAITDKILGLAEDWYGKQVERGIGCVTDGNDDIIVGSISDGKPDIEWEFLEEKVWKGLPDKAALSRALRDNVSDEREGGFKIFISGEEIKKVKYSRRMVFGPFLAIGIASSWLVGFQIVGWYISLF